MNLTNEEAIFIIEHRDSIMDYCESKQLGEALEMAIAALKAEPCEDAVRRETVRDMFCEIHCHNERSKCVFRNICKYMNRVSALPPVAPKQEWTHVSEELPKDRREVLVTAYWHETYQVMMASYFGDGLWWCVPFNNCGEHMQRLNPKAWMPLPEPYKKGESE